MGFRLTMIALMLAGIVDAQVVTAVTTVKVDGRPQKIRKINGRWWSQDNRQLTPPGKHEVFWHIQKERIEGVEFHHHRPLDLPKAEGLRLFMNRDSVRALLGDPNETWDKIGHWRYYAADGTALFVRFLGQGELGEARYERSEFGISGKRVAAIERELAGRNIHKIMADRAWQRSSPESYEKFQRSKAVQSVAVHSVPSTPEAPKRKIAADLLSAVEVGMTRAQVIEKLGEPGGTLRISGGEKEIETLSYFLESGGEATIRIEDGKVARIRC